MKLFTSDFFAIFLIEILISFLSDDTFKQIYEARPRDMVHMLSLIHEDRMCETVGMQDLLREDFSIVVEVIDSESAEVT